MQVLVARIHLEKLLRLQQGVWLQCQGVCAHVHAPRINAAAPTAECMHAQARAHMHAPRWQLVLASNCHPKWLGPSAKAHIPIAWMCAYLSKDVRSAGYPLVLF